jgi:hypothetical protein
LAIDGRPGVQPCHSRRVVGRPESGGARTCCARNWTGRCQRAPRWWGHASAPPCTEAAFPALKAAAGLPPQRSANRWAALPQAQGCPVTLAVAGRRKSATRTASHVNKLECMHAEPPPEHIGVVLEVPFVKREPHLLHGWQAHANHHTCSSAEGSATQPTTSHSLSHTHQRPRPHASPREAGASQI